jgi:ectoine hydroxylase-related dioxygenase (phytanoyl-CoA dioxygenase family)
MTAEQRLRERGFAVVPGPVPPLRWPALVQAYDAAVSSADPTDVKVGSTTTRVTDFVNRDAVFDELYVYEPLLAAARAVIGRPFRLSTMHARTLRPHMPAQGLHVDFARRATDRAIERWPMVGFIYMIDEFRPENGATRFLPGSHTWPDTPARIDADDAALVAACAPAGSVIVFNGSVWHGHGANRTDRPRRSIQGAYIERDEPSGMDLAARMRPDTLGRISPLARRVLAL